MTTQQRLIWVDHFDGAAGSPPDPSHWRYETGGHGWGNDERQTYTDQPANAFQDGRGNLHIVAIDDPQNGFTSARLITKGLVQFQYGRFETRAKLASGAGLWSVVGGLAAGLGYRHPPLAELR